MEGLSKKDLKKLNGEVRVLDRKMYHVILVKKIHDIANERYLVSFLVQQYNKRGFENLKKSVVTLGYHKAIVLHDPTQLDEDEVPTLTTQDQSVIEAKVKKELEEKHKKEIEDLKKKYADEAKQNKSNDSKDGPIEIVGEIDIEKAVKADIEKFAKDNNIDLGDKHLVEEIRTIVAKWLDDSKPQE